MASLRFIREHTERLDKDTRKTWPQGWIGEVDAEMAAKIIAAGAAEQIGGAPEPAPAAAADEKAGKDKK